MFDTLILDFIILIALVLLLGRKSRPKLRRLLLVSLGAALAFFVCDLLPARLFAQLIMLPLAILTAVVLVVFCRLKMKPAALAAGLFLVLHIFLGAALEWFF